jgi:hypothetical protein
MRKDTKFVIVLIIVLISLYLGYERSNIKNAFFPHEEKINAKEADKMFSNLGNIRKAILKYDVANKTEAAQKLNDLIFSEKLIIKYSDAKDNYVLTILELPNEKFETVLMKLKEIDGLAVENILTGDKLADDESIQASIKNNEMAKKRIQELIDKTTSAMSINSLKQELEETQTKIDSLKSLTSAISHFNDHDIIYISLMAQTEGSSTLKKASLEFILTTVVVMIILIVGLIIFYFIYVGLTALMRALGIRSSRSGSSNYNYNYNRSYGRKVKRIYKDKDGNRVEKKDTK